MTLKLPEVMDSEGLEVFCGGAEWLLPLVVPLELPGVDYSKF